MQLLASLAQFLGQREPTTLPPSSASSHEALGTTLGCQGSHTGPWSPRSIAAAQPKSPYSPARARRGGPPAQIVLS